MFSSIMKYLGMDGVLEQPGTSTPVSDVHRSTPLNTSIECLPAATSLSTSASDGALINSAAVSFLKFNDSLPDYKCRKQLPSTMLQKNQVSVWSILKHSIGKELSKITMPVVFNEPLSFIQRIAEYMEYYDLLLKAADEPDPVKRLEYVAAFAVSALASNWERVGKPFNPLLGETYELDRINDLGFRFVCEQVSHHPPISAFHANGEHFKFHGSIHPKLKFWGQSLEIQPKGIITLELTKFNDVYTWTNVSCSIHNLVMGKLWIEQHGVMEIVSHKSDLKATLNFKPSTNWFGKENSNHIEGFICNKDKNRLRALYGTWTQFLASCDVATFDNHFGLWGKDHKSRSFDREGSFHRTPSLPVCEDANKEKGWNTVIQVLNGSDVLWRVKPRPNESHEYYHFTSFALLLNELDSKSASTLPSTDSRLRPDIRCLENADLDGAAIEKNRLEEKQRETRNKKKKHKDDECQPLWFSYGKHPYVKEETWLCNESYWQRNFSRCADIF